MKSIIWSAIGIVACMATFDVANWIKPIASVLPTPLLLTLFVLLAAGVWIARTRVKLVYAFWEITVGFVALAAAAQRAPVTDSYNPEQRNLFFISLVGGIFLLVRGVEDCREAFPEAERAFKKCALKAERVLNKWGL
jgi:hypothetical protein